MLAIQEDFLTLEDGADRLSRDVGTLRSIPEEGTFHRKLEITHSFALFVFITTELLPHFSSEVGHTFRNRQIPAKLYMFITP
jgi:hypothetical protein